MKKIASLILAVMLVLAMAVPAMAATVTIPADTIISEHDFVAYQIFVGTQAESETALGDVVWGDGINNTTFAEALKNVTAFAGVDTTKAADVAAKLATFGDSSAEANAFAKLAYDHKVVANAKTLNTGANTLDDGYYLIVDNTANVGESGAYNAALLQVTETIEITVKTDAPSVEKKVKENVKNITGDENYGDQYNDVADYNIGDAVPFAFYSAVPDMTYYETYKMVFHDVMSDGLTFNADSVKVTIGATELTKGTDYTVETSTSDGCDFHIVISDLKKIEAATKGAAIRVDFTATLNSGAVIGLDGNTNKVKLEYSNKPNESGESDTNNTGNTPWDHVIVFTYELDVTKTNGATVEADKKVLADAEFVLYREKDANTKEYALVDANNKVTGWTTTKPTTGNLKSGADGKFAVIGLDDGTYYLEETKAPAGYNLLTAPIKVVITATTANGQNWDAVAANALTALTIKVDDGEAKNGTTSDGKVAMTVVNNVGSTLPETGGMGTTLIYAVGALLVAGAVVVMISKKRAASK